MVELAFDASAKSASVCIIKDDEIILSRSIENGRTHSEELMPLMHSLLDEAGLLISDVENIYVANGPGSFTGIRIALSIAKSLAHALDIPVYPVSTLDALSYHGKKHDGIICPIMDARRSRVYTAIYDGFGGEKLLEPSALAFEELLEHLAVYNKQVLFVGDGIEKYRDEIISQKKLDVADLLEEYKLANSEGVYMAAKAYDYAPVVYNHVLPIYLRKAQAERERDARKASDNKKCT